MTLRFSSLWLLLVCLAGSVVSTGCSHYQLGTGGKLTFSTLYVEPAENRALVPQVRATLTNQLREALLRDGRVTLVNTAEAADATLQVTVRDYHREVSSLQERDTGLARKFSLSLAADCTLRDRRTGAVLFENRRIDAQRDAFVDGGQQQAEYQTMPVLAQVLASKIAHAVLDVW